MLQIAMERPRSQKGDAREFAVSVSAPGPSRTVQSPRSPGDAAGGGGRVCGAVWRWITLTCRTLRDVSSESAPRQRGHDCDGRIRHLSHSQSNVVTGTVFRVERGGSHGYTTVCCPRQEGRGHLLTPGILL